MLRRLSARSTNRVEKLRGCCHASSRLGEPDHGSVIVQDPIRASMPGILTELSHEENKSLSGD